MVNLYTQDHCGDCANAKSYLDFKGIEYREIDVKQDDEALQKIVGWGYSSTPVFETEDGEHWDKFRMDRMNALL